MSRSAAMGLEQSIVFRQLEQGSRFSRFDVVDGTILLVLYGIHYNAELFLGGNLLRPWITLLAAGIGVYFLRVRLPNGLTPLLHVMLTPRHLSSMAEDVMLRQYPGAAHPERRES